MGPPPSRVFRGGPHFVSSGLDKPSVNRDGPDDVIRSRRARVIRSRGPAQRAYGDVRNFVPAGMVRWVLDSSPQQTIVLSMRSPQ